MELDPYLTKKVVSLIAHLIPGIPILMLLALCMQRLLPGLAKRCLWFGVIVLLLFSSPLVTNALVSSLENRFKPLDSLPHDTAVLLVLGAGHQYREDRSANSVLSATSLSRVTEAIRLWQSRRSVLLVTSGIGLYGESSNAEAAALFALNQGVPEDRIHRFHTTHDTAEEIRLAVDLLHDQRTDGFGRLVVVSSAIHLVRARQLISPYEIDYTLAPTDYIGTDMPWYRLDSNHLRNADRVLHEYIGMLWQWFRESYIAEN